MQVVFVTGATGFLGSHLVCALLQKGYFVQAAKRAQSSLNEFTFISDLYFGQDKTLVVNNLKWVEGDILDYEFLLENIKKDQLVFHCAGLVSFHKSDQEKLYQMNVVGTKNMVNACLENSCKKLIHVSSTTAIGKAEGELTTDETNLWDEKDGVSNYSASKYYAELEVWRGIEEGLKAVIVNPCIIIGPGDWNRGTGLFFRNASRNFPFYTSGSNAFVSVFDVAKAMIELGQNNLNAERYLVIGENLKFQELMNLMSDALKARRPRIEINPWLAALAWRWYYLRELLTRKRGLITKESADSSFKTICYSNKKIKDALNFEFTSIKDLVEYAVINKS